MRNSAIAVVFVAITSLLMSCFSKKEPDKEQIWEYLQSHIPDTVEIADLNITNSAGEEEGSGRSSVVGTVRIKETTYVKDKNLLINALKSRGFSEDEIGRFSKQYQHKDSLDHIYKKEYQTDTLIDFTSNLLYRSTPNGIEISGSPSENVDLYGITLPQLPSVAIVNDSQEFDGVIQEFINIKDSWIDAQKTAKETVESIVAGKNFVASHPNVYSKTKQMIEKFNLSMEKDINWSYNPEHPDRLTFSIFGESLWLADGSLENNRLKKGEKLPVLFKGTISDFYPEISEASNIKMTIYPRENGEFYTTGSHVMWKNGYFEQRIAGSGNTWWRFNPAE